MGLGAQQDAQAPRAATARAANPCVDVEALEGKRMFASKSRPQSAPSAQGKSGPQRAVWPNRGAPARV